jgi:hypothetical protein
MLAASVHTTIEVVNLRRGSSHGVFRLPCDTSNHADPSIGNPMTIPCPDHQRRTGRQPDDAGGMETFTVPLPQGPFVRLFSRNPLLRITDRLEALFLVLALAVPLLAVPISAAVGTAIHDSRSRLYTEQAQTRHTVSATVIGDSHRSNPESQMVTVPARWFAAGAEQTGDVTAKRPAEVGDTIDIWVDNDGSPIGRPQMSALDEAVAFGAAIWCALSLSGAALYLGVRMTLDRVRYTRWQQDFDSFFGRP